MRRIDDHQFLQHFWMRGRKRPGNHAAPIVANQHKFLGTQLFRQRSDIFDENRNLVGVH